MRPFFISLCFALFIQGSIYAQKKIVLSNPTKIFRTDELIVLKRDRVEKLLSKQNPFLSVTLQNTPLTVQFDDLDGDGQWDEAVFLQSFKPNEHIELELSTADQVSAGIIKAHVRHKRKNPDQTFGDNLALDSIPANQPNTDFSKEKLPPFLTEGPAWENDKVGFRLYFDIRNGKDIWGKTTERMMMDTVGVDPKVIYHHKAAWGMDIYKVGSSLSAGALAIKFKLDNQNDTLIRLGGKNMGKVIYKKIADGPVRAKFLLTYPEWQFAKGYQPIRLSEEISIWGGQYFYESKVKVQHQPKGASLVTGFANLFNIPSAEMEQHETKAMYSFGIQSENKDNLGLAVLAPKKEVLSFGKIHPLSKDVKDSYLIELKIPSGNKAIGFRFFATWQASDSNFSNLQSFDGYLHNQALSYSTPISIHIK